VFIQDAAKPVAWLKKHINEYGTCKSLFIGGHSAGAYLAMMLCFDKSYLFTQGIDADELNGYIFCSGQPTTHFNILKSSGNDVRQVVVNEAAPVFYIHSTGAPLQIICTDNDIENRLEQTQLLVSTLHHFRYESEVDFQLLRGYDHSGYLDKQDSNHSMLYQIASDFIRRHSGQ
jgi:hypothetical protein